MTKSCSLVMLLVAGCMTSKTTGDPDMFGSSRVEQHVLPEIPPQQLDLLFVVDNTMPMSAYRERLAMLPALVEQVVASFQVGFADMHVAVTTHDGVLRRPASASVPFVAFATGLDFTRSTNFEGMLVDVLGELLAVDAAGAGPSTLFDAQRRALDTGGNGFVREHAYLGIIVISASDDASTVTIDDHVRWLKQLKSDPANVLVTGIYAEPAPRLDQFFAGFPNRSVTISIDAADYTPALATFDQLFKLPLGAACWHAADLDPIAPGPQYECSFTITFRDQERVLPPCAFSGDSFCWYMVPIANGCTADALWPMFPPFTLDGPHPALRAQCVVH